MKSKSHGVSLAKLALTRAGAARIVTNAISREPPDNRPDIFSPSLPRNQALAAVVMAPHSRYYVVDVLRSPEGPWRPSPAKSGGKSAAGKWRCHKESRANEWKTPAKTKTRGPRVCPRVCPRVPGHGSAAWRPRESRYDYQWKGGDAQDRGADSTSQCRTSPCPRLRIHFCDAA
jgi:hypothetical protein